MKRFAAMMLAALLAASSTTVAFAAKNYDYIEFGGWVTLDYDAMDGGNVLVPGNTYTFPILNEAVGASGTFWLYGGICLAGFLFIRAKLPETKGKTLEELEKELTK